MFDPFDPYAITTGIIDDGSALNGTTVDLAVRPIADLRPGDIVALTAIHDSGETAKIRAYDTVAGTTTEGGPSFGSTHLDPTGDILLIVDGLPGIERALTKASPDDVWEDGRPLNDPDSTFPVDETGCAATGCDTTVGWALAVIPDAYDSGHERVEWFYCYIDRHGRLFCEEHGG